MLPNYDKVYPAKEHHAVLRPRVEKVQRHFMLDFVLGNPVVWGCFSTSGRLEERGV